MSIKRFFTNITTDRTNLWVAFDTSNTLDKKAL